MVGLISSILQGGANREGPSGSAVAVREPDGVGRGEEVCSGEQCQTDRGQVGLKSQRNKKQGPKSVQLLESIIEQSEI